MMFDVHWDDGALESIGHKKTRGPAKKDRKKDSERLRASISSKSSLSSGDKPTSFFGNFSLKRNSSRRGSAKLNPPTASSNSRTTSLCNQPAIPLPAIGHTLECSIPQGSSIHIGLTPTSCEFDPSAVPSAPPSSVHSEENSTKRSSKDTALSESTQVTAPASPPPFKPPVADTAKQAQLLAENDSEPAPCAAPAAEAGGTLEDNGGNGDPAASNNLAKQTPLLTTSGSSGSASTSTMIHSWFAAVHEPSELSPSSVSASPCRYKAIPLPPNLRPPSSNNPISDPSPTPTSRRNRGTHPNKPGKSPPKASNPSAWRTPAEWEARSKSRLPTPVSPKPYGDKAGEKSSPDSLALDLSGMKREVAIMAAARPHIAIARMNEDWGASDEGSFYKELEMEKKRWMLSTLDKINKEARNAKVGDDPKPIDDSTGGQLLLSLFETQATASYLAGVHPTGTITHLAPHPLSGTLYPNVCPLPSSVTNSLSLPRNRYNQARCLPLPSLLPSSEIPTLLRGLYHCLAPKGVLHLILLDPTPTRDSLGPRMRDWLEDNLLINLEAQFRCTSPNRVFPLWLTQAGLRGDGSVITKVSFNAVHQPDSTEGKGKGAVVDENSLEAELRTTMGRKLWQEIWGSFVLGKAWWWDDPACVEECARLGTSFEYSIIEAVKEDAE